MADGANVLVQLQARYNDCYEVASRKVLPEGAENNIDLWKG